MISPGKYFECWGSAWVELLKGFSAFLRGRSPRKWDMDTSQLVFLFLLANCVCLLQCSQMLSPVKLGVPELWCAFSAHVSFQVQSSLCGQHC